MEIVISLKLTNLFIVMFIYKHRKMRLKINYLLSSVKVIKDKTLFHLQYLFIESKICSNALKGIIWGIRVV